MLFMDDKLDEEDVSMIFDALEEQNWPLQISFSKLVVHERPTTSFPPALHVTDKSSDPFSDLKLSGARKTKDPFSEAVKYVFNHIGSREINIFSTCCLQSFQLRKSVRGKGKVVSQFSFTWDKMLLLLVREETWFRFQGAKKWKKHTNYEKFEEQIVEPASFMLSRRQPPLNFIEMKLFRFSSCVT